MKYGYARVSTEDQHLDAQIEALKQAGCERIFAEKVSAVSDRPRLKELLSTVQAGDTIVITKLDRLARSTQDALRIIDDLNARDVALVVLNMGGQQIDTTTATGRLMVTVLSAVAEFERNLIRERQREGIEQAKKRGVYRGRIKKYHAQHAGLQHALKLFFERDENKMTVKQISQITQISVPTIYREARRYQHLYDSKEKNARQA